MVDASFAASSDISLRQRLFAGRNLLSLVAAAAAVYLFFFRRFDLAAALAVLGHASLVMFLLGALVFYSSLPLRGYRWRQLLIEADYRIATVALSRIYLVGWFVNCLLPARLGDLYRAYILKRTHAVPMAPSLAVLLSEKIFDIASTAALMVISGAFYFNQIGDPVLRRWLFHALLAVVVIVALFAIFAWRAGFAVHLVPARWRELYISFGRGLFRNPAHLPIIAVESVLLWLAEAGRLYFVALALGVQLDFLLAVFLSQSSLVVMSLPLTPAGVGLVELLMSYLLQQTGLGLQSAATVVLADRLISVASLVVIGAIHYLIFPRYR